jgi:hypothetical protein
MDKNYIDGHPQMPIMEQLLVLAKLFGIVLASLIIQAL